MTDQDRPARRVLVHADAGALARATARRFVAAVREALDARDVAHVSITGGTIGIEVLEAVARLEDIAAPGQGLDWRRIHVWWGDERFVPAGDPDRNAGQAAGALLDGVPIPDENVHPFPASDEGLGLDEAAVAFAGVLAAHATEGSPVAAPVFDVQLLGVGPDGHVDSLFPGRPELAEREATVLPVRDSPKPPPLRLTLTYPVVNAARRNWLVLNGAGKADVLARAVAGAPASEVPLAGVSGTVETLVLTDTEGASGLPAGATEIVA